MVDWKKLGKQALNITKDVTEKGVESFNDWKDDPERLEKVAEKKELKMQQKEQKKMEAETLKAAEKNRKASKKIRKYEGQGAAKTASAFIKASSFKPFQKAVVTAYEISQSFPGKVTFSKKKESFDFILDRIDWKEDKVVKGGGIARTMVGGAIAGPAGMLAGSASRTKDQSFATFFVVSPESQIEHTITIQCDYEMWLILQSFVSVKDTQNDVHPDSPTSNVEQLREFKQLLDEGVITQEEFEIKKQQILNQ